MYLYRLAIIFILFTGSINAQRLDQLGKARPLTLSGGIAANMIYYEGTANRDPFTYFLSGNVNANIYGLYNIPVSFAYTNQQFNFNEPSFKINRLSLHPSYKWIATHIGDVAMTFSPYTLNGHQFTGFGTELTPNGPIKFSAMYGRLVRPREYNEAEPQALPSYKRMGYGAKVLFDKPVYGLGLTFFKAKDEVNSVEGLFPEDLNITPKENVVVSFEGRVKMFDKAQLQVEYAQSALTYNLKDETVDNAAWLSRLVDTRASTSFHNAVNVDFSYIVANGSMGVGYERIDPHYETLGSYYFNNDLENITAKISQTLFKNKLNLNVNAGIQRDDLADQKQSKLNRLVTALNMNYRPNDNLTLSGSYSNFRAHTQIRNQFDYINAVRPYDNLDTLNFTQISRNANLNVNYAFSKTETKRHTVNMNVSYQQTDEQKEGFMLEIPGNNSKFLNTNMAYSLTFSEQQLSFMGAFNATYNTLSGIETTTLGPTLAVIKQFFDKKMRTHFSSSYNTTTTGGVKQGDVLNFRLGANYMYKEGHNFNLNFINLLRNSVTQDKVNDFTATLGYTYNFTNRKKKRTITKIEEPPQTDTKPEVLENTPEIEINYKGYRFSGTPSVITRQLDTLKKSEILTFSEEQTLEKVKNSFEKVKNSEGEETSTYKNSVYAYLDIFDGLKAALPEYQKIIKAAVRDLAADIVEAHLDLEKKYVEAKAQFEAASTLKEDYTELQKAYQEAKTLFMHHSYIYRQLQKTEGEVLKELHIYQGSMLDEVMQMKSQKLSDERISSQVKMALIAYYDELATENANEEDIILLKTN